KREKPKRKGGGPREEVKQKGGVACAFEMKSPLFLRWRWRPLNLMTYHTCSIPISYFLFQFIHISFHFLILSLLLLLYNSLTVTITPPALFPNPHSLSLSLSFSLSFLFHSFSVSILMSTSGQDHPHHSSQFKFQLLHSPSHIPPPHSHPLFPNFPLSQRYEINNVNSHSSNIKVAPDMSKTISLPPPVQIEPSIRGKQNGKSKVARNAKSGTHRPNADSTNLTAVNNCRYDSSLGMSTCGSLYNALLSYALAGLLTKKFVSLIQDAKDGTLDLNKTAEVLEV
ncbi:Transcription factor E2FC, partial [Mucuna pruriens]